MRNSLNDVYRLIWSRTREAWVPVAEHCKSAGKSGTRAVLLTSQLVAVAGATFPSMAHAVYTADVSTGVVSGENLQSGEQQVVQGSGIADSIMVNSGGSR